MNKKGVNGKRAFFAFLLLILGTPAGITGTFHGATRQDLPAIEAQVRAAQFLTRTTFGPNKDEIMTLAGDIQEVGARTAFENWIDIQFGDIPGDELMPTTLHHDLAIEMLKNDGFGADSLDYVTGNPRTGEYRHYAWWHTAIAAPDQLRQRMAWALSQIFVINETGVSGAGSRNTREPDKPDFLGPTSYYDMLVRNAFGNYRDVIEDVTYHPMMGTFLSHRGNRKADPDAGTFPDENYAREIKQLMSIGLYEMKNNGDFQVDKSKDPIPAYDNIDIENFARVFTGLDYAYGARYHNPMRIIPSRHDTEEKALLNSEVLPALTEATEASVAADIDGALDNLFYHQNTAPFISRLLIQRFVKSNPSSRYIEAVSQAFENNGQGVRGDFKAVIKEILLNPEAMESLTYSTSRKNRTLSVSGGGTEHSRLQEPVLRYTAFIRAFKPNAYLRLNGVWEAWDYFAIDSRLDELNQEPYRSPSVFNFYRPDHVPQGELQHYRPQGRFPNKTVSAPEFQIMTAVAANRLANQFLLDINDAEIDDLRTIKQLRPTATDPLATESSSIKIELDFFEEEALAQDPDALLDHLSILLCQGTFSDNSRDAVSQILVNETDQYATDLVKAQYAILAMLTSPDCVIHE